MTIPGKVDTATLRVAQSTSRSSASLGVRWWLQVRYLWATRHRRSSSSDLGTP